MTTSFAISTLANQLFTTQNLQKEQNNLATLNEQLASGKQHSDLTQYAPVDAHNLMDFQNAITQRQSYIGGMTTVSARLSMYDTTMNNIETMAAQAGALASSNQTYDPTKVAQIQAQAQSYLQQMQDDLNQTLSGRYIYGGTRYATTPVANLTSLGVPGTLPFTPVTSPTLPDYSAEKITSNSFTIAATPPTGNFQVGNSSITWASLAAGTSPLTVTNSDGTTTNVAVSGLTAPATTTSQLASNVQKAITQIVAAGTVPDFSSGLTAAVDGTNPAQINLTYAGSLTPITPNTSGTAGQVTWADSNDGTTSESLATTDAAAYAKDSVTVDNGYNLQYGVTSNDPGFQQVIAGLRLLNAASSQTDPTVYNNYVTQAATLLSTGLNNVQTTHAAVAGNSNIITQETSIQNTDITNLQNQLSNIQQVDLTSVGTQITLLQTQLQASYSSTAALIQESILKYL